MAATIPIEAPMSVALHRLAHGFLPSSMTLRSVLELRWGGVELDAFAPTLRLHDDLLLVECLVPDKTRPEGAFPPHDLSHAPLTGRCEDDAVFSACDASIDKVNLSGSLPSPLHQVVIACQDWGIRRPTMHAQLWAGILDVELPHDRGNMILSATGSASHGHHRLRGRHYDYYLVQKGQDDGRWILAVDPRGAPELDHGLLRREMMAMSFSFGCPFVMRRLHGLDSKGNHVGILSGFGAYVTKRRRVDPPVPGHMRSMSWSPTFFNALSVYLANHDVRETADLTLALGYFLEAMNEPSDGGVELKMLLALIAAARLALGGVDVTLAADRRRWDDWVSEHREPIEKLSGVNLSGELIAATQSAARPQAGSLVRLALSRVGLGGTPSDEMSAAVESSARGLLGKRVETAASPERAAVLRTLLVALLAKTVGYDGPIYGWERPGSRLPFLEADPAWWPVHRREDDLERFVANIPDTDPPLPRLKRWPSFRLPLVPTEGPIAAIAAFADALEASTGGLVIASVVPAPQHANKLARFNFVLQAKGLPSAQASLFSIEDVGDGAIRILGWGDCNRRLRNDAQVATFLNKMARRDETRLHIQRLQLIADQHQR